PLDTCSTTRGNGWVGGCDGSIPTLAGGGSNSATPEMGGCRSRTGSRSSTPPRFRSSDTGSAAPRSPLRGPARDSSHQPTEARGEPDAVKVARPVRAGGLGKRTWSNPGTAPQADPTGGGPAEQQLD